MSEWLDGTKPKYIEARYSAYISWDLDELGIDYDTIKDYHIKYGTIYVEFKDGTSESYEGNQEEIDYKWALSEGVFDEDWDEVEGLN